jgi:hypothetical protein
MIDRAPGPRSDESHQAGRETAEEHSGTDRGSGVLQDVRQRSNRGKRHEPMLAKPGAHVVRTT